MALRFIAVNKYVADVYGCTVRRHRHKLLPAYYTTSYRRGYTRMMTQTTNRVLMIEPRTFGYDPHTASDNVFQSTPERLGLSQDQFRECAVKEFNKLTSLLEQNGVEVNREKDNDEKDLPDAVFPNNWISFHESPPKIVVYPMMSPVRRQERQQTIVDKWRAKLKANIIDMSRAEEDGQFLEGTGSMVLDRANKISYAAISLRTCEDLTREWCKKMGYTPVFFRSFSRSKTGQTAPIYHTNVMLSLGEEFALVCLESIQDQQERETVVHHITRTGKTIIPITLQQVNCFLGNALQLHNNEGQKLVVMSTKAYKSMDEEQKKIISKTSKLVHCDVDTIENLGGGGVRCMIAEIFPATT